MALLQISEPGQATVPHEHRLSAGIDLGTTNSLVATVRSGKVDTLPDSDGRHLLPSIVHFGADEILVGFAAQSRQPQDPLNTLSSIKRLMGRGSEDIKQLGQVSPYRFADNNQSKVPRIVTAAGPVSAIEVSSEILKALASRAEQSLGGALAGVVITVPAYFDDTQRQATRDAATLANLEVLRLISEPTAAAVAYGLDQNKDGLIVVYDLGGGTFDVSILHLNKGVFEVLATGGDSQLGGDDIDHEIGEWILAESGFDNIDAKLSRQILLAARAAKECLSENDKADIALKKDGQEWCGSLSKNQFQALISSLIKSTLIPCRRVLRDAGISKSDITEVILVGGTTRIPLVNQIVAEFFECQPMTGLDPDRVVAIGAAIQADVLAGNKPDSNILLLDVLPLSLGIETMGGLSEKIILRNAAIPVMKAQQFTTFKDGQTSMSIHVVQGERELVRDCRSLANFELHGIPPMAAGAARITVSFQVDADGLLSVRAEEKTTGVATDIVVKPSYGLTDHEIESMLRDSINHAQEDVSIRMLKEQQVEAKRVIEAIDAALASDGEALLDVAERSVITQARDQLKDGIENDSADSLKKSIEVLEKVSETYVARRMNTGVKQVLEGRSIDEVQQ